MKNRRLLYSLNLRTIFVELKTAVLNAIDFVRATMIEGIPHTSVCHTCFLPDTLFMNEVVLTHCYCTNL